LTGGGTHCIRKHGLENPTPLLHQLITLRRSSHLHTYKIIPDLKSSLGRNCRCSACTKAYRRVQGRVSDDFDFLPLAQLAVSGFAGVHVRE
jgi:hypothetical protein